MDQPPGFENPKEFVLEIDAELKALPVRRSAPMREVRRKYSRLLKGAPPEFIFAIARELLKMPDRRWVANEIISNHKPTFARLAAAELEEFGQGIDSWHAVDGFARGLSGPAWLKGQVPDALIHKWAHSPDRWWRRAALVSTVALNMRSHGGKGDVKRTLAVCRLLAADDDDMVVKAMSWALRELVVHDAQAVKDFLAEYDSVLAERVKREVRNKLTTGLKNPRRNV